MRTRKENPGRICTGLLLVVMFAVFGAGMSFRYTGAHAGGAPSGIIYVTENGAGEKNGTSWENAMSASMLDSAAEQAKASFDIVSGEPEANWPQIWVASGLYTRTKTLSLDRGVRMYGGFAGTENAFADRGIPTPDATIITRAPEAVGDFSLIAGGSSASSKDTVIESFTITGGKAQGLNSDNTGGGMSNKQSSPSVINCIFLRNTAKIGGAMYNYNGSSPFIKNCSFIENEAEIIDAVGGDGGAISSKNACYPTIENCSFQGNTAQSGGAVHNQFSCGPSIVNSTFSGNKAWDNGGAIVNDNNSNPTIINCTISENKAQNYFGGGIHNTNTSNPILLASVIWNNTASKDNEIYNSTNNPSSPAIAYCVIKGDYTQTAGIVSNITSADPQLTPLDRNLKSAAKSSDIYIYAISESGSAFEFCPQVGSNSSGAIIPSDDQTGFTRKTGVSADAGAYSYNIELTPVSFPDDMALTPVSASVKAGERVQFSITPNLTDDPVKAAIMNGTEWKAPTNICYVTGKGASAVITGTSAGTAKLTAKIGGIGPRSAATDINITLSADITVTGTPKPGSTGGSGGCNAGMAAAVFFAIPLAVAALRKKNRFN